MKRPTPKRELDAYTLRHCARVLRVGAAVDEAWAVQPGTGRRAAYGLEVAADDLRAHADSFAIHARSIERTQKRSAKRGRR
jgi:hypothetical protein